MPGLVSCEAITPSMSNSDSTMVSTSCGRTSPTTTSSGNPITTRIPASFGRNTRRKRNITPRVTTPVRETAESIPTSIAPIAAV